MSFSQGASGQKVPAWKRLGLKLKATASTEGSQPNDAGNQELGVNTNSNAAKRKQPFHSTPTDPASSSSKRARFENSSSSHHDTSTPSSKKLKSVSFTDDTKRPTDVETHNGVKTPAKKKKPKKAKGPAKDPKSGTQPPTADILPSLEYLRAWKTSRDSWKFNKNFQTILIKRLFDANAIPAEDIDTFYEYIRDLKGFTRKRLQEAALEVKKKDAADGSKAFPEGTMDVHDKQSEYDTIIAGILQLGLGAGNKRKHFDEAGYVAGQSNDAIIAQRVVKRMRAELVLEELSDTDESTDAETVTTVSDSTNPPTPVSTEPATGAAAQVSLPEDGKRARRRKQRVAADDTSSDESSGSDSESGSSSSGGSDAEDGSDDSDSDGEQAGQDDDDTSSDDSGSSDSDSESDDDDDNKADHDSDDSSDSEDEASTTKVAIKRRGSK